MITKKLVSTYRAVLLGGAVCLGAGGLAVSSVQAEEVTPPGFSRVYINIQTGGKGAVVSALAAAGGKVHYEFDGIGAIAASIPNQALAGLSRNPNVSMIEPDPQRFLLADTQPYGIGMIGAPQAITAGTSATSVPGEKNYADGTGITVGVIDSGIYPGHDDFADVNIGGYPTELTVTTTVKGRGKPTTTTETTPLGPDDETFWGRDYLGHGTHVTGTIAAAANNLGVVGVSPGKVNIFMVKVFGDAGNWVYSSTLLDAAQQAKQGGANIISMSLGGGVPSSSEESGLNQLYAQNVLLVAAAGNDGTTAYSYPASYNSVISVAAIDSAKLVADFSQKNSQVELAAPGVSVLSTLPYINTASVTVNGSTFTGDPIEFAAQGTATGTLIDGGLADTMNSAWAGKVVLVQRGSISFYDKVMNVQNSDGLAVVIYNNAPGGFLGTLGAGNSSTIPAISVSDTDGMSLKGQLGLSATVTNTELIPASGFGSWNGTSMATPHVSGAAALIWSKYPNATAAQVRDALDLGAEDLGTPNRDTSFGYGLVRADVALNKLQTILTTVGPTQPLSVVVGTDKVTYVNRDTVTITATVKDGSGAGVGGAAVHLDLTTASGGRLAGDATSDANGTAKFTYKVNSKRDGIGPYLAYVTATKSGYDLGAGSTTFEVTR